MDSVLSVSIGDDDASAEQLEAAAGNLREELLGLAVDDVRPVPGGPAPDGARGVDAVSLGTMLVSLPVAQPLLESVIDVVRRWTSRSAGRTVKIELDGDLLELSHASRDQQRKLVEDWLRRRAAGEGSDGSGNA